MSAPRLYERNTSTFNNNGFGVLSDAVSYEASETVNGKYEMTLQYPVTGAAFNDIQINRILYGEVNPYGDLQPFRIYRITKPLAGIITVYAEHKGYELSGYPCMANDDYIETPGTCAAFMAYLTQQAADDASDLGLASYSFATDIVASAQWSIPQPVSIREAMTQAQNIFGGERQYSGTTCTLYARRGQDRGVSVRYGTNLTAFTQGEDTSDTYTHLMPYWTDGTETVYTANKYIILSHTTAAMQKRVKIVDFSGSFVEKPTPAELEAEARASDEYLKPHEVELTYDVQFVPLGQTTEYAHLLDTDHVELGDTIAVKVPILGIDAQARVNRLVYDGLRRRYKTATCGTIPESIAASIRSSAQRAGVNVFTSVNAPTEKMKSGDYWIKIDNDTTRNAISVGRYTGGNWLLLCKFAQGGGDVQSRSVFFSANEPGGNAASGDFWAVQPDASTVSKLYKYGTAWQEITNFTYGTQPPQTPAEGDYWAQERNGELFMIFQYVSGSWTSVSYGHNLFIFAEEPPKDGDLWIKRDSDTDKNVQGVYSYTEADGWTLEANASAGAGENLPNNSVNFNSLTGTQYANADTRGYKNSLFGQENSLTDCQLYTVGGMHNTGTDADQGAMYGRYNTDEGYCNITGGYGNNVTGSQCVTAGHDNSVGGINSIVAGSDHDISNTSDAVVCGDGATCRGEAVFYVAGNGTNTATIDRLGYVTASAYNTNGADYAEYFEWADGNPNGEDRRGMLVQLASDKIKYAHGDDIDGIVSVNPSVCGNDFELYWHGKYAADRFGAVLRDEDGKAIISAEYDESREYIPRSQRKEWSPIGLCGQMIVRDNGKCQEKDYVSARYGIGVPTTRNTRIKCLKRISDDLILCLIR